VLLNKEALKIPSHSPLKLFLPYRFSWYPEVIVAVLIHMTPKHPVLNILNG